LIALLALAAVLSAPRSSAQSLAPKNQVAAVMVGHSLINFDMPWFLEEVAKSKNLQFAKAVQVLLGSSLRNNLLNCSDATSTHVVDPSKFTFSCDAIAAGSPLGLYDTLVLTDANNTIDGNRQYNRTDEAIADYMDIFLARNPAGRVMLFTTWEGIGTYGAAWPDYQAADLARYEAMARAATALAASRGRNTTVEVIPVDVALRDLIVRAERGEIPGITSRTQIFLDDVHMNTLGNYYVACVVFAAIFNRSPEGATGTIYAYANQPPIFDLPVNTASTIQRLAWEVVSTYRGGAIATKPKAPTSLQVR
jgi:hypothetical protein